MATLIDEDFEGGTNGAALTTGNTAFSSFTGTPTFDNSVAHSGTLSMLINPSAATEYAVILFTSGTTFGVRWYEEFAALPAANTIIGQMNASATVQAQVRLDAAGTVTIRNGTTATATTTAVLSAATLYRFEWVLDNGAGTQELKVFLGDATTAISGADITGTYNKGAFDRMHIGVPVAGTLTANVDDFKADSTAIFLGPATLPGAGSLTMVGIPSAEAWGTPLLGSTTTGNTSHNPLWPLIYDQLALNVGANDPSTNPVWTDITDRVVSRSLAAGRSSEMDHTEAADNTYRVRDRDEEFNPANTAGPFYGSLLPYRRIRTLLMWPLAGNIYNHSQPFDTFLSDYGWASSFEDGSTGGWLATGSKPPTLSNSTTHAFDGTHALLLTLPTGSGGQAVTAAQMPPHYNVWGLKVGDTYSISVRVWIDAGVTAAANLAIGGNPTLTGSNVLSTTTTGSWVKLFATFICNDASANVPIVYLTGATTSGQHVWVDAAQNEWGSTSGSYLTTGPTVFQPFIGFVERWPRTWDHQGLYGYVEIGATDALGAYGQTTFVDPAYHRGLQDSPDALYPLTDPSGTLAAGNVALTAQPSLAAKNIGNGGGSINFGSFDGPTGVGRQVAQFIASSSADGIVLTSGQLSTPIGGAQGITLYGWFNVPSSAGWAQPVTITSLWNSVSDYVSLAIGVDTGIRLYAKFPGVAGETVYPAGAFAVADDKWHFVAVSISCSGTTYTINVTIDGGSFATTTVTGVANPNGPGIVGPYNTMTAFGIPKGRLFPSNGGACYLGALSRAQTVADLVFGVRQAGFDGFAGDTTIARLSRVAAWFGHSVLVAGSTSVAMQGAQVHDGKTGPDIYGDIVDTEGGALYVSSGFVVLQTRLARELAAVPFVTFGEDAASGEVPYEADFQPTQDVDWIYNDITVNQANGPSVRVADAASKLAFFERDFSLDVYSQDPGDAADHASYLLFRYKDPQERIAQLSIEAGHRGTAAWSAIANSQQPNVIQVKRRLANGVTVTGLHRIDHVSHDADDRLGWKTQIQASPIDLTAFWLLGDATRGVLGSTTIPGW